MYYRPWPIVILAFLHIFVKPIVNIFLNAHLSGEAPLHYFYSFLAPGEFSGLFCMLVLPVIMGCSIFLMKKWSYAVFVACSCGILFQYPLAVQLTEIDPIIDPILICLFFLSNIGLLAYFLLPAVKEPYYNARLRWWETAKRYIVTLNARVAPEDKNEAGETESPSCQILDISTGGVFVSMQQKRLLNQGQSIRVSFSPNNRDIVSVRAKVVFQRSLGAEAQGYGLQFIETTAATQSMMREVVRNLKQAACPSRDPVLTPWQDFRAWSETLLSTGQGLLPQRARPGPPLHVARSTQVEMT
jgi:hypothetical protein